MKKILLVAIILAAYTNAFACTNFIVGKAASADGSVFCTYNADDYGMFIGLCHYPAGMHDKGTMRQIYDWDTKEYHGQIPEAEETYNVIGNINEFQVSIGETTFGGRHEMVDTTGILDYGSLIYIALQRSKTAREAIKVMTTLAEKYGYCSEGETFSICDPEEAWIMEMMGKGPGSKGVVWVALRIPDNAICAHANQSRIRKFDQKDKKNVMYSKDCISFAKEKGWFTGKDEDFSFCETYAYPDFSGRRFCEARVWSFFNHFSDDMDKYLPYAEGKVKDAEPMPLWIIPNKKVTLQDVRDCMRDHYEGTPFANDDGNMVAYTPIYCGNTEQPECYNTPGADAVTFNENNAYWICNWVSNMVYPRYSLMFGALKAVRDSLERSYDAGQAEVEATATRLYAENSLQAIKYLNEYSNLKAEQMLDRWKQMAIYMIVKYNDMTVKPEENGTFKRTETGLGATVERPGFPGKVAREIVHSTGDKYAVPTE